MHRIFLTFAAFLASLAFTTATAGVVEEREFSAVEEKVRTLVPNASTIAVAETPIPGLLQVQINSEVIYVTEDGQYLLQGQIINIDTRMNITDQAKSGIRKAALTGLDPEEQITFAPEKADYNLLVFTDIECGYCRKLHNQMAEYNDNGIAIHYLAFPRAGIGSASYDKYVSVWCAEDQKAAMTLAKNGGDPEPADCQNPIAEQYGLARDIGVTGTPAIVTADGMLIPGYVPPVQLRQRLEALAVNAE
ncbi:MAG: thioredoxin fold domain-containing protein [Lysobacterales bacterium]|jgi:thiol:disulfide interchange protein DsbC